MSEELQAEVQRLRGLLTQAAEEASAADTEIGLLRSALSNVRHMAAHALENADEFGR